MSSISWNSRSPISSTRRVAVDDLAAVEVDVLFLLAPTARVLVDSLSDGDGAQPYAEPRPVVNTIMLAPPATWPVADTGS